MWRYCFLIVLLLAGCGEARVEVLPTVVVERPFPTSTATLAQPTAVMPPTQTPVPNTPTQVVSPVASINTPTQTPIPVSSTETPLPPVEWSAAVEFVRSVKSETIHWSPVANEFVVYCPVIPTRDFEHDDTLTFFVAPEFQSEKITPKDMICPTLLGGSALT